MSTALHSGHVVRFGYRPNPPHTERFHARMHAQFGQGLADLIDGPDDDGDRYNYRALMACVENAGLGSKWLVNDRGTWRLNTYDQGPTNTCHGQANAMRLAIERGIEIVSRAAADDFRAMPAPEVLATGCEEIDGTIGSDYGGSGSGEMEGLERFGAGYALEIGSYDLTEGNAAGEDVAIWTRRCRQFLRQGLPAEVAAFGKNHLSQAHVRIETPQELWRALGHGYPCLICSDRAYESDRDDEGVIRTTGANWPHAMACSSRRTSAKHGRVYLIHNSWVPNWTGGPYWLDQPLGSFWAVEADVAKMLACHWQRRTTVKDSWIGTGAKGFKPRADELPIWVKLSAA
jgi:hypothetical protein